MRVRNFFNKVIDISKKATKDHLGEYGAVCAYYTFLSFIPFIVLLLSLIKYMNIEKGTLVYIFEAILPSILKNSVLDIIQAVYSKSIEIVSISAIFILWSASRIFYALNKGLAVIYDKEEEEGYIFLRIKGVLGAIIALILIISILLLLVFGNVIESTIDEHFEQFSDVFEIILMFKSVIAITVIFLVLLLLYRFSPRYKGMKWKQCLPGALFSTVCWYFISYFFSIYVNISTNFSVIYGSLTTITLIMMWLYTIFYVILLGAEINCYIQTFLHA